MDKDLVTNYEELHRCFVLLLLQEQPVFNEFITVVAGIHARIASLETIHTEAPWLLRVRAKFLPFAVFEGNEPKVVAQPDWIIDFLFADGYKRAVSYIDSLSKGTSEINGVKRALIHFGCSPDSIAWDMLRDAPIQSVSHYDVFRSLSPYKMADFLAYGRYLLPATPNRFRDTYAKIIEDHAKAKANKEWRLSSEAFSFFCEHILAKRVSDALGKEVLVQGKNLSQSQVDVCFSLLDYEWPIWDKGKRVDLIKGATLHVHFLTGALYAYVGLSHRGAFERLKFGEKPIDKEKYERLCLGKTNIQGFQWVKSIDNPLHDEFAYARYPIWIREPEENPIGINKQAENRLVQDIVGLFKQISE